MKKTFYYLAIFLGLALTSCEPMDDIHDEINSKLDNERAVGDISYTLTEDNYKKDLGLSHSNFDSVDDAKILLPGFLADKYPNYGTKSTAVISFDVYAPVSTEKVRINYTVTTDDYDSNPDTEKYNNFDKESQIFAFLNSKYTDLANRTLVSLTYKFYDGSSTQTLNNGFLYVNGEFNKIMGLSDSEYQAAGESYSDFSSEDEANAKLPIFLKDKYKYDGLSAGTVVSVMYKLYKSDADDIDNDGISVDNPDTEAVEPSERLDYPYIKNFVFNGTDFELYNNSVTASIKFGSIDGVWIPDNTIRRSLTGSDYSVVGSALIDVYPGPADNVGSYQSFDIRTSSGNYWNPSMLVEAMNVVLDNLMPNAEEGQQYVVTFAVYNGAVVNQELSLIKKAGVWVLNQ